MMRRVLVFGSTGHLGAEICKHLESKGEFEVVRITSDHVNSTNEDWTNNVINGGVFEGVVWAQGANHSDSIWEFNSKQTEDILNANLFFIAKTLRDLLTRNLLRHGARLVIISSVWQSTSRPNKLSYSISKSAISGLVGSLVADLQEHRIAVNAVLPGVVDSPMSRANLTPNQISKIQSDTPGGNLVSAREVARVSSWLLSPDSSGINGQSITIDNGWGVVRFV